MIKLDVDGVRQICSKLDKYYEDAKSKHGAKFFDDGDVERQKRSDAYKFLTAIMCGVQDVFMDVSFDNDDIVFTIRKTI